MEPTMEERIHAAQMEDAHNAQLRSGVNKWKLTVAQDALILIEETSKDETSRDYAREALEKIGWRKQ